MARKGMISSNILTFEFSVEHKGEMLLLFILGSKVMVIGGRLN